MDSTAFTLALYVGMGIYQQGFENISLRKDTSFGRKRKAEKAEDCKGSPQTKQFWKQSRQDGDPAFPPCGLHTDPIGTIWLALSGGLGSRTPVLSTPDVSTGVSLCGGGVRERVEADGLAQWTWSLGGSYSWAGAL